MNSLRSHYAVEITPELADKHVELAGWAHEIRNLGGVSFVILRDRTGLVQVTAKKYKAPPELIATINKLVKETVIKVHGRVKAEKQAPRGVEVEPESIEIIGPVTTTIPFEVTGKVPADIDVRLDNRFIDFRRLETTAIFQIEHHILQAFRQKMCELGCQEIRPPSLVGAATEGGTELFSLKYFEKDAYLAQSPQLYKQLAVVGGMDKVFMVVPVFRAEKHNTRTHLNEITQMDAEIGFTDDEGAMDYLEEAILHILHTIKHECREQLDRLGTDVKVPDSIPRLAYSSLVDLLKNNGTDFTWGNDFNRAQEEKIRELSGHELYFITRWPTKVRAFYSMPLEDQPEICRAFDIDYRGLEIASGAQRIHIPELLEAQLRARGLNPADFEFYIRAFRMGAPPHAGWSFGLERLAMQICGRENIREAALFPRDRTRLTP